MAYVNASVLFGNGANDLVTNALSQMNNFIPKATADSSVIAGYKAIYNATVNQILTSPLGLVELLIGNNIDGAIRIGASLQHPLSHGRIYINSSNPMDYPVIDPNYLAHPTGMLCSLRL